MSGKPKVIDTLMDALARRYVASEGFICDLDTEIAIVIETTRAFMNVGNEGEIVSASISHAELRRMAHFVLDNTEPETVKL